MPNPQTSSMMQSPYRLLTQADAAALDRATIALGTEGLVLMERAGAAVAVALAERYQPQPCMILCGMGNNGGDGFIVAELLRRAGWPVFCTLIGDETALQGDALRARALYQDSLVLWSPALLTNTEILVDALFGIGLNRSLSPDYVDVIKAVNERAIPVIAIDMPSGVQADTGAIMEAAIRATLTVTFTRKKPGLLLLPGCEMVGEVLVASIGIDEEMLQETETLFTENSPQNWQNALPRFTAEQHKYDHGHALILGGGVMTGAARLAARAAQRTGTGLVTIAAPPYATLVYASNLDSVLVQPISTPEDWEKQVGDPRKTAYLLGPGAGANETLQQLVLAALATGKPCVLDADALTCFAEAPEKLFRALHAKVVITPHSGEFSRLFGPQQQFSDKLSLVSRMARLVQCVVLLKGADTVIAAPDGRAVINTNAPVWLATAGSGDVLAGIITGFLAQGVEPFTATCMAAWLHGQAAQGFTPGMIAEDLVAALPTVLQPLRNTESGCHAA